MKHNIKRILNLLLAALMIITLPGFSKTIEAADTKELELYGIYLVGDVIKSPENNFWIIWDDSDGSDAEIKARDYTVPVPSYSEACGQWKFEIFEDTEVEAEELFLGYWATGNENVIGFKCVRGNGSKESPFAFELVYSTTVVLEVGEGHSTLANNLKTQYGEKAVSINGTKITLSYPSSATYEDVVTELATTLYGLIDQLNPIDNNELFLCFGTKPLSGYESYSDAAKEISDYMENKTEIGSNGATLYFLWNDKSINEVKLTIDIPEAGTKVTKPAPASANDLVNSYFNQSPRPVVYSSGENYSIKVPYQDVDIFGAFWYKDIKEWNTEGETNFIIMEKGKSYLIHIILAADENYFFANPVKLTINGKVIISTEAEVNYATSDIMLVNYSVEAAEDGFNVVSGNNQTWTKGSTTPLSFTFKRAVGDSLTFNWFYGIRIDNDDTILRKDEHPEIFSCDSGSVIIDLEPKYLEKMSVGNHTLTAVLRVPEVDEKYMTADASFTIAEKTSNDTNSSSFSDTTSRFPNTGVE